MYLVLANLSHSTTCISDDKAGLCNIQAPLKPIQSKGLYLCAGSMSHTNSSIAFILIIAQYLLNTRYSDNRSVFAQ